MDKYEKWITENVKHPYGKCKYYYNLMLKEFPELTLVRGHYHDYEWGDREHWWLVDPDDNIVDPIAHQFPSQGYGHYTPRDESQPEPTGKCLFCGGYIYEHGNYEYKGGCRSYKEHMRLYAQELNSPEAAARHTTETENQRIHREAYERLCDLQRSKP